MRGHLPGKISGGGRAGQPTGVSGGHMPKPVNKLTAELMRTSGQHSLGRSGGLLSAMMQGPQMMPDHPSGALLGNMRVQKPQAAALPSAAGIAGLKLTPQEMNLYQHHADNLRSGGAVKNQDGSTSTIRNITIEQDGRHYVIPTVWGGRILSNADAMKQAAAQGWGNWPVYRSESEAENRYSVLHELMARDVAP